MWCSGAVSTHPMIQLNGSSTWFAVRTYIRHLSLYVHAYVIYRCTYIHTSATYSVSTWFALDTYIRHMLYILSTHMLYIHTYGTHSTYIRTSPSSTWFDVHAYILDQRYSTNK
jgi:hypothetical protein